MSASDWTRVSRSTPCPICGRRDWCLVARDGSAVICQRVKSGKRIGDAGFLHPLRDADVWRERKRVRRVVQHPPTASVRDFARLAQQYARAATPVALAKLAAELGVGVEALRRLHVGWDGVAWTFPMGDAAGCVVGIRRRLPDGRKLSVRGGREGLFIPAGLPSNGPLLLPEGPTDTAALLGLEFAAVGRPSCVGGVLLACELARGRPALVVADADEPGQRGAGHLARVLRAHCPSVRIITPPDGVKDARAWVSAGATRKDVQRTIDRAAVLRIRLRRLAGV